jgi:hypothetical protein
MSAGYMSKAVQGWGASQSCAYCHGFAKIPPLIRGSDGRMYINPDYQMVKRFTVRAEPFGGSDGTLAPGEAKDFAITVPAEEEDLGDLLINELLGLFGPDTARNLTIEILSTQTTRTFQNAPIFNTLLLGNAHLNCCLPCCTLVQATNSLLLRVTNNESIPVEVKIAARGKRFLPKSDELRARMLMYWNSIPSIPYYLTLDDQEVTVPAGETVTATMTVQGTGDFEAKWARCEVLPAGVGAPDVNDIDVQLTTQVGRQMQSGALPLGAFVATPTLDVAGFPGDLYRAASACHCPPLPQLLKRNTKLRVTFTNTGGDDAIVRLTFAGCFHFVGECPPGRSMDRIRSLEPSIGPLLIPQRDYCPPAPPPPPEPTYAPAPLPQAPAPAYQAPPPPAPARSGPMYAAVAGGAAAVTPGGPLSYMFKYYQPGPGGMAVPKGSAAAAHGYDNFPMPNRGAFSGMGNMPPQQQGAGSQYQLQPGQLYWDPVARVWRRA